MRVRVAFVAVLAVAASGCMGGVMTCQELGPWTARWAEPGLFRTVAVAVLPTPYAAAYAPPSPGLPLVNETKDDLYGPGNWSLARVHWSPPADPWGPATDFRGSGYSLSADLLVEATLSPQVEAERVHWNFVSFVDNLTDAPADRIRTWADAFVVSVRPVGEVVIVQDGVTRTEARAYQYQVKIEGPANVQPIHDAIAKDSSDDGETWGGLDRSGAYWSFEVDLASIVIRYTSDDGTNASLNVSAAGWTLFMYEPAQAPNGTLTSAPLVQFFEGAGLPAPTGAPRQLHASSTRCAA